MGLIPIVNYLFFYVPLQKKKFGIKMAIYLENTKRILQKLKPILSGLYHVDTIGLFGSIVRNDFVSDLNDIDIVVSFTQPIGIEFTTVN
jgi:predicted nucleotidyltransferase